MLRPERSASGNGSTLCVASWAVGGGRGSGWWRSRPLAPGDPELVFVVAMCAYATNIVRGLLPGPFDAADACRFARAVLIPEELLEREELDVDRAAAAGEPVRHDVQ